MNPIYVIDDTDKVYKITNPVFVTISDLISGFQNSIAGFQPAKAKLSLHFQDGTEISSETLLENLKEGTTLQTTLVLRNSPTELYGVKLTKRDQESLVHYPGYMNLFRMQRLDRSDAIELLCKVKCTLGDETITAVILKHGVAISKALALDVGSCRRATIRKAIDVQTGQIVCAKCFVNFNGFNGCKSAVHEYEMSQVLKPHLNIVEINKKVEFCHQTDEKNEMIALVMPLYNTSLREQLDCIKIAPPLFKFVSIAFGLLSAGSRLVQVGLCHGDIKPSNVVMDGLVPVLIDLGSVVPLGTPIQTLTLGFSLDAHRRKLTPEFDLNCIVTTLASCFVPEFEIKSRTRGELKQELERCLEFASYASICLLILQHTSSVDAFAALQGRTSQVYTLDATFE